MNEAGDDGGVGKLKKNQKQDFLFVFITMEKFFVIKNLFKKLWEIHCLPGRKFKLFSSSFY